MLFEPIKQVGGAEKESKELKAKILSALDTIKADGRILYLSENGDDSKTFFRDAGGLALDGFQYDGSTFTDYFTRIPADNNDINGNYYDNTVL